MVGSCGKGGVTEFEAMYDMWNIIKGYSSSFIYTYIDTSEMTDNEKSIYDIFILLTFILIHRRNCGTYQNHPALGDLVCSYIACVITQTSIEQFFNGPFCLPRAKRPGSWERIGLSAMNSAFPMEEPTKISELLGFLDEGQMNDLHPRLEEYVP